MDLQKIEELLGPKLGPNKKITNVEVSKAPVKGIGSVMLNVKVIVQDENNKKEPIYLVGKKIPASETTRKIYNIQDTFKNEIAFYRDILPILKEFQNEEKNTNVLDIFAEFYGARYNLDGKNDIVDEDGVMLLEDLKVKGFGNATHDVGFDLIVSERILQDLARFHGTAIALKLKKPELFQKEIKPKCTPFDFREIENLRKSLTTLREIIRTFPEFAHLAERATNFQEKETPTTCREPFGSIIHFDLWVNNILNKIENDGTVRNVFVDFQVYDYRSPAADVFFFMWTSIEQTILEQNLDHFLHHYHKNLINTLEAFGIDTSPFGYENFKEELRLESDFEFGHALLFKFLLYIFKDMEKAAKEELKFEDGQISREFKKNIHFMVSECLKRGWFR